MAYRATVSVISFAPMTPAMFIFIVVVALPPVAVVSALPALLAHRTVLSLTYGGTRSGAGSRADHRAVPAPGLIAHGCAGGAPYRPSQDCVLPFIEIGTAGTERCDAER